MLSLVCEYCGKEYRTKKKTAKYCSHKCANVASAPRRKRQKAVICQNCKKIFFKTPGEIKRRGGIKFCSHKCQGDKKRQDNAIKVKCQYCSKIIFKAKSRVIKGRRNYCDMSCLRKDFKNNPPNPGKGFWLENGYKIIQYQCKPIKEHRHFMEQHLGRKLLRKEVIHHVNGIKTDNRIENMKVISQSEHRKLHLALERKKET